MRHRLTFLACVAVTAVVACKSGGDNPIAGYKPDSTRQAIQGAWILKWEMREVALEITGDSVKRWDGKEEKTYTLDLSDPCQIGFKEPGEMGSTTYFGYVQKAGQPVFGQGDAGQRTGKTAVVCAGVTTYAIDASGACKGRMSASGRWRDEKCGFRKDGDQEVFYAVFANQESTLPVDGDLVWSNLQDNPARKVADYAAAKAGIHLTE